MRFPRSSDVHVAYQVVGDGPLDLVYVQGYLTHLDVYWELPAFRRYCERLGEFTRLIVFDKCGMGMSDRVPGSVPLELRMDDLRAVMDAAGSERAALLSESEGGPLAMLFAAAHPERTAALVLQGAEVRERTGEEWPWGEATEEEFEAAMPSHAGRWGQGRASTGSRRVGRATSGRAPGSAAWRPTRRRPAREASTPDRALARVLFTDLVGSTARAAELGDSRWGILLEQHHAAVRGELARFDGRELDTAGDGFFATFDGSARAIRCAHAIIEAVRPLGLELRAGPVSVPGLVRARSSCRAR